MKSRIVLDSMLTKLVGVSSEILSQNPFWQYKRDIYCLPNGVEAPYYYASTRGSVFIIARDDDGNIVLMNQFRYLNQRESLEFPGGGIAENVQPLQQAMAELHEEAGVVAQSWTFLGEFNPMNGLSNEICHVYLAEQLMNVEARPEDSEEFEKFVFSELDIKKLISTNRIWDGMTLAAWSLFSNRTVLSE